MDIIVHDVRYFANSSKRLLHVSDPRGAYICTSNAARRPADGVELVDREAVLHGLPHQLRKAFMRALGAPLAVWKPAREPGVSYLLLEDARGHSLGALYATRRAIAR
jgi:hypothetical protein